MAFLDRYPIKWQLAVGFAPVLMLMVAMSAVNHVNMNRVAGAADIQAIGSRDRDVAIALFNTVGSLRQAADIVDGDRRTEILGLVESFSRDFGRMAEFSISRERSTQAEEKARLSREAVDRSTRVSEAVLTASGTMNSSADRLKRTITDFLGNVAAA